MKQRGRKSTAALSIVAGTSIDQRPEPPITLTDAEAKVWIRVVNSESAETFRTAALQAMLVGFCRHIVEADNLSAALEAMLGEVDPGFLRLRIETLRARAAEMKDATSIATKLRLTNQSRWQPSTAASKANRASTELKPWQTAS